MVMEERYHFITSHMLKADDLYINFPAKKHLGADALKAINANYDLGNTFLFGQILRYFFYLMIQDIIENRVTFKFPPFGPARTYMEMVPIHGEDFKRARKNGAFQDVDFLASNFTGYQIYIRVMTRYGKWQRQVYVSKKFKDRITELTNMGKGW